MAKFPYTHKQIKECQKKVEDIESDLAVIRKTLGNLKATIQRFKLAWEDTLTEIEPLTSSITDISECYKPIKHEWKAQMGNNVKFSVDEISDLNSRQNYQLTELEGSLKGLEQLKSFDTEDLDNLIQKIQTLENQIKPLDGWRAHSLIKELYKRI